MVAPQYEHNFPNVEDYLHHRPPYLLVDEILSVETDSVATRKRLTGDEFFFAGHFPGAPIFPGALMQEMATQSAGILIAARHNPMETYNTHDPFFNEQALGVLVRVKSARYWSFARPGDTLDVQVQLRERTSDLFEFGAEIRNAGKLIMRNVFQLTNVPSLVLQGSS